MAASSVFAGGPVGTVVKLPSTRTATFSLIDVPDFTDTAVTSKASVTGFTMQEAVNAQFTHTMGDDIYMNVFGNRMGKLQIDGIAFNSKDCDVNQHGIVRIINYYKRNRVSSNPTFITVTIGGAGGITVKGAIVAATFRAADTLQWMVNYSISIATVPRSS
jgi:hypothetical protein